MGTYETWLREETKEFKHIIWLSEHLDCYEAENEEMALLEDLKHYGSNVYTYPQEALSAYKEFCSRLYNNPYKYMSACELNKITHKIFSHSPDGYLAEVSDEVYPIGFLKTGIEQYGADINKNIHNYLSQTVERFKQEDYKYISDKLVTGKEKYRQLVAEYESEKALSDKKIYRNMFCGLSSGVAIVTGILGTIGKINMIVWLILTLLGSFIVFWILCRCVQGYMGIQRVKRLEAYNKKVVEFSESYVQKCNEFFTVKSLMDEKIAAIQPLWKWEQYKEILDIIDSDEFENLKILKPLNYNVKVIAMIAAIYLLLIPAVRIDWGKLRVDFPKAEKETTSETPHMETETEETQNYAGFDENGFLFGDSDSRYLTEEEIYQLQYIEGYDFQTLLGFARNEFYARKGYAFNPDGKYYAYYMQYGWYSGMEHGEVTDDMFNEYERKNLDLIIRIEVEMGYR